MATAQQIVNRALKYINVADISGNANIDNSTHALEELNQMIDEWNSDNLIQTSLTEITHSLVANDVDYTIGSGGNINTNWPVKIENAFIRDANNNDYVIEQINAEQYATIADKTSTSSYPSLIYYKRDYPLGKIYLYPAPSSGLTLHLYVWGRLSSISLLTDSLTLPPGYESLYSSNLAIRLAPQYGIEVSPSIYRMAKESKRKLEIANYRPLIADNDLPIKSQSSWNIFTL